MDAPPSSSFFLDPTRNTYCPCSRPNQHMPSHVTSYALHALHALLLAQKFKPCVFQEHTVDIPAGHGSSRVPPTRLIDPSADQAVQPKSQGLVLYWRQFWALFVKRAISAKRDRLAVVLQLLVPILLVLLALRAGNASSAMVQEPSLDISRYGQTCVCVCVCVHVHGGGDNSLCASFPWEVAEICTLALHRSDTVSVKVAVGWRTHAHE